MTYKEIEHIKVCKQLMREAANRIDMTIKLREYNTHGDHEIAIELRDINDNLLYTTWSINGMIGFIHGYEEALRRFNHG